MVAFELWEMRSGNLVGSFESEDLALAALREAIRMYGAAYAETIALVRESARGRSKTLASGAELAARAERAARRRSVQV